MADSERPEMAADRPAFEFDRAGAAGSDDAWTFARLLGPVTPALFASDYWGRHPLHVRSRDRGFYTSLVTLGEVEALLGLPDVLDHGLVSLRTPQQEGSFKPETVGVIYGWLQRGASLQFRKLERFLPACSPLVRLYRDVLLELQHLGVSISCFLTPPGTALIEPHCDETEIFTLQIAGRKRWRLFGPIAPDAHGRYPPELLTTPVHDVIVGPGDLLYLPRGNVHAVTCEDELSFSVPLVLTAVTWKGLVTELVDRLSDHPDFAAALPAGMLLRPDAGEQLAGEIAKRAAIIASEAADLDGASFLEASAANVLQRIGGSAAPHVAAALDQSDIATTTMLRSRHGRGYHVLLRDDRAILALGGGDLLSGPAAIAPALRAIMAAQEPCAAGALHMSLSERSSILLARRLVRVGALGRI